MVCYACGKTFSEGTLVCPHCGAKASAAEMREDEWEATVKACLRKHFDGIHQVEPNVLLFCNDAEEIASIPAKMIEPYTDDAPLLVFKDTKNLKNGIVITQNAICTAFLGLIQVLKYRQIESGWCGKAAMFKGMKFNLREGGESESVDLSAMNDPVAFVDRLNAFLAELPEQEEIHVEVDASRVEALLADACRCFGGKDEISVKIGTPLSPELPKYSKAMEQFCVPSGEAIYAICDETLFGTCKIGFALTPSGLYYRQKKKVGTHTWAELVELRVYGGSALEIGKLSFYCMSSGGENLAKIIRSVCKELKK